MHGRARQYHTCVVSDPARCPNEAIRRSHGPRESVALMFPDKFLLLLLFLRLLVNELLVDVNVLVCHLLRDSVYPRFLDKFLLHVLHEKGRGRLIVVRIHRWKKVRRTKDGLSTSTVACKVSWI